MGFLLARNISMFDTPNMQVLVNFFYETFRISCGKLVVQVRILRWGHWKIWQILGRILYYDIGNPINKEISVIENNHHDSLPCPADSPFTNHFLQPNHSLAIIIVREVEVSNALKISIVVRLGGCTIRQRNAQAMSQEAILENAWGEIFSRGRFNIFV